MVTSLTTVELRCEIGATDVLGYLFDVLFVFQKLYVKDTEI